MAASSNLEIVKSYLAAIEAGATGEALGRFYSDDVVQEEFPNRLLPAGARRDKAALLEGAVRGQKILRKQRFDILGVVDGGQTIVLELQWTGTLAVPVSSLQAGEDMRARFAVFIELRDDKIVRQRNYDCFDAF